MTRTTEQVVNEHVAALVSGDVPRIMADYAEDALLIVDDVYDSGRSVQALIASLKEDARKNTPADIRIATIYYKPSNNKTNQIPDYYLYETDAWLVFPHELNGLSAEEINEYKPRVAELLKGVKKNENNQGVY